MTQSLQALLAEWQVTRSIILGFLEELSDADLDKPLPRKVLNTIRLQAYELTLFQRAIVNSLSTKSVDFDEDDEYKNLPTKEIIHIMTTLDKELEQALATLDGTETIHIFGDGQNVHQIIATLIGHETMHIGQIIAFCYATGIPVPEEITESMALEG